MKGSDTYTITVSVMVDEGSPEPDAGDIEKALYQTIPNVPSEEAVAVVSVEKD